MLDKEEQFLAHFTRTLTDLHSTDVRKGGAVSNQFFIKGCWAH